MSITEYILRLLSQLRPLLPGAIATVAVTVLAALVLYFRSRSTWVEQRSFPLVSLFFSLDGWGILGLSCAWIKLVLMIFYLAAFRKLVLIQYLSFLIPGIIFALASLKPKKIASGLFWLLLELMGLLCANLVCGYIQDTAPDRVFLLIYIAMALFLALLAIYLFLLDLGSISEDRSIDPNLIWRKDDHGENPEYN